MHARELGGLARTAAIAALVTSCTGGGAAPLRPGVAATSAGTARTSAVVEVPFRTRFEIAFDVPARTVAPEDVTVVAQFTAPSGAILTTGGFLSHGTFHVRFTPREVGLHRYVVNAEGGVGWREVAHGSMMATRGGAGGFVGVDPRDKHRLVREDGQPVYVLGENRVDVYDPSANDGRLDAQAYLARMASFGMRTVRVLVQSDCVSETAPGGYQIGCLEPSPGRFDERTADAFDALFDGAERSGIDVVLVAFAMGFTPGADRRKSWTDNPYSLARGGPARAPEDMFTSDTARAYAARRLRYIADRWGASPRLLAIDLLNEPERDGPIPEATWIPWAEAMSATWRSVDPYHHLVTTGSVGPELDIGGTGERPWYASPRDDIVQWHVQDKELRDPRALAREMSRRALESWSFGKPVVCGDLAYGGKEQTALEHTHVGIWSLAFSGAGALAHSDAGEPMTAARGARFKVLSDFLSSFDIAPVAPARDVRVTRGGASAWSLVTPDALSRGIWLLGPAAGYGGAVSGVQLALPAPPAGPYVVSWRDDTTGGELAAVRFSSPGSGEITLAVPTFARHIAARVHRDVPLAEHATPARR